MKPKRKAQITVDALMLCILLLQMSYSIAGELLHEILGISLFVLFILHHIFSADFSKTLVKGRKSPEKMIKAIIDILLTADIIMVMFSAVIVSKYVFTFLGINTLSDFGRTAHLLGSYWGFALMSIHLGLHLDFFLRKAMKDKRKRIISIILMVLLSGAGLIFFIHDEIYKYMLLINRFVFFDNSGGLPLFLLKYIMIAAMFSSAGYAIDKLLRRNRQ